jgi:sigma-B regulation protein RsbU (phosphoserine phosphatase)
MASLRASLRAQTLQEETDLARLMANLNVLIYESSQSNRYATFFYAEFQPQSRRLSYVNAGHNPPMLLRQSGQIVRLDVGGTVVGLLPMSIYEQASLILEVGDELVAFTDGVSEAMNAAMEEWGEERLQLAARQSYGASAQETMLKLLASADAFAAGAMHDEL